MLNIKQKDALTTKAQILKAAEDEFAEKGFFGARVDEIAQKSGINKRIIYRHYLNKENLYKIVLTEAYMKMANAEKELFLVKSTKTETIKNIIRLYFEYLKNNPTYVNLILWENLNKGQYIKDIDLSDVKNNVFNLMEKVLREGKENGEFNKNFKEEQVILSILTFTFSYYSNKYTLGKLFEGRIEIHDGLDSRIEYVTDIILSYIAI